ncbi:hypothetical protein E0L36_12755 [Streptomyces sp. AJS327]|uniref:DUF6191 domain-containing protein n=1 Tax=Streptomyces sp. AJS327 TaxID=2545265 RepID=UPI0015DE2B4A|nr:DUF6191 domain-containing protein [Streptomyces sp. AJS327]MBA0051735.1 hypothetical protein [Streptomyces sp. AJS327]
MMTLNVLEELFVPGSHHTHEERKRLEHSREDAGSNDPGCGPIDLASGRVVITLPAEPAVLPPRPRLEEDAEAPSRTDPEADA